LQCRWFLFFISSYQLLLKNKSNDLYRIGESDAA
jgi:hypothetical protein